MTNEEILWSASPSQFVLDNHIRNENGSLIEFHDHRFLVEPYNDLKPLQAIPKCSQIGWSVLGIIKAVWLAHFKLANVIYTLPSKSIVKDFVTPKVDPILINNPIFQGWLGKTDSVALKQVNDRFVYFRGSWEESAAISISAHVLINDELDRSNQKVVRTYRTRLDDAKENARILVGYGNTQTHQFPDTEWTKCGKSQIRSIGLSDVRIVAMSGF